MNFFKVFKKKLAIIKELLQFLKEEKKWWLIPLILLLLIISLLTLLAEASPIAPFIYTIF